MRRFAGRLLVLCLAAGFVFGGAAGCGEKSDGYVKFQQQTAGGGILGMELVTSGEPKVEGTETRYRLGNEVVAAIYCSPSVRPDSVEVRLTKGAGGEPILPPETEVDANFERGTYKEQECRIYRTKPISLTGVKGFDTVSVGCKAVPARYDFQLFIPRYSAWGTNGEPQLLSQARFNVTGLAAVKSSGNPMTPRSDMAWADFRTYFTTQELRIDYDQYVEVSVVFPESIDPSVDPDGKIKGLFKLCRNLGPAPDGVIGWEEVPDSDLGKYLRYEVEDRLVIWTFTSIDDHMGVELTYEALGEAFSL